MLTTLRGHDIRHILGVEFGVLEGLELRDEGFFVPTFDDVPAIADHEVDQLLEGRAPGECLLALPATVDAILDFAEDFPAIKDRIDPRKLIKRIEQAARVQAQARLTEEGSYHWTEISQVLSLRQQLQAKHDSAQNDSRKVALREVLDSLARIFPDPDIAGVKDERTLAWPWGNFSTQKLEHLAAAVSEFWHTPDTSDPPKNDVIEAWLLRRGLESKSLAGAIATIIRPDTLTVGRPTRKKPNS